MRITKIPADSSKSVAVCLRWLADCHFLARRGRDEDGDRRECEQKGHHLLETLSGRDNSRTAPIIAAQRRDWRDALEPRPGLRVPGVNPSTDPMPLNTKATVFVTLAVTGGRPTNSRAG